MINTATPQHKRQYETKQFEGQMKRVFAAFQQKPQTMLMVENSTGINRANICRYIAKWHKLGNIHLLKHGFCEVSKHRAGYYTTDKTLICPPLQLNLL